jgi:hypothetical protein
LGADNINDNNEFTEGIMNTEELERIVGLLREQKYAFSENVSNAQGAYNHGFNDGINLSCIIAAEEAAKASRVVEALTAPIPTKEQDNGTLGYSEPASVSMNYHIPDATKMVAALDMAMEALIIAVGDICYMEDERKELARFQGTIDQLSAAINTIDQLSTKPTEKE